MKNTMQTLEKKIAELTKRGDQLAAKRAATQTELDNATEARQQALLAGDLNDQRKLNKLQAAVDSAKSALDGFDDAIAVLTREKAEAEGQLSAERDRAARADASEKITTSVVAIERRVQPLLSAMRDAAEALSATDHFSFEAGQLGRYLAGAAGEAELAFAFVLPDVRRHAEAIKAGSAPIPRRPEAVQPSTVEQSVPTMTVFMLRSARYRDHDGRTRFAGQFEDTIMQVATSQKAMRLGLAVSTADPRRAQLRGARGSDFRPGASDVVDIDTAEEGSKAHAKNDVIAAANFTEVPRGPERTATISVQRF